MMVVAPAGFTCHGYRSACPHLCQWGWWHLRYLWDEINVHIVAIGLEYQWSRDHHWLPNVQVLASAIHFSSFHHPGLSPNAKAEEEIIKAWLFRGVVIRTPWRVGDAYAWVFSTDHYLLYCISFYRQAMHKGREEEEQTPRWPYRSIAWTASQAQGTSRSCRWLPDNRCPRTLKEEMQVQQDCGMSVSPSIVVLLTAFYLTGQCMAIGLPVPWHQSFACSSNQQITCWKGHSEGKGAHSRCI